MRPMILPYVDETPSISYLMQARIMVHQEATNSMKESDDWITYSGKLQLLQDEQRQNMQKYNEFQKEMHLVRQNIISSLASESTNPSDRKRARSSIITPESEMLKFEGMLTESLELELQLNAWQEDPAETEERERMALIALQNTQEVLKSIRRRTEEINALRYLEQQQCARVIAEKEILASRRLEKIKAMNKIFCSNEEQSGSRLLRSLE